MLDRLRILTIKDTCTGCGACMNVCPTKCISIVPDKEGFLSPNVDESACVKCNACEKICHVIHPKEPHKLEESKYYMGYSSEVEVRANSTSGGAFSLFANEILKKGGVVFASCYNPIEEHLNFDNTDTRPLSDFRKTCYFESNTLKSYSEVKQHLKDGRWVLYCGTPCHISGLKGFLRNNDTTNLLTVDFICHGVPSNEHFTEYKRTFENKQKKVVGVNFRHKPTSGWHNMSLKLDFSDNTYKSYSYSYSYSYRAFLDNLALRRSCYGCTIVKKCLADVTIGDFWGIHTYKPEIDDNKGLSLFIVHNSKAQQILDNVDYKWLEQLPYSAIEYAYKDCSHHYNLAKRNDIISKICNRGYVKTIKPMYVWEIRTLAIKRFLRKLIKR